MIFNCVFVTFLCGILGQVCYLFVSISDLCRLPYFYKIRSFSIKMAHMFNWVTWPISFFRKISLAREDPNTVTHLSLIPDTSYQISKFKLPYPPFPFSCFCFVLF